MVIAADAKSIFIAGEDWHSDASCDPERPMRTILYLTEVPPDGGGDTMFASMYLAYETLSQPVRKLVDGLTAIHDGEPFYPGRYGVDDSGRKYPRDEHPCGEIRVGP
jgi:taurine dioxygenase